MLNAIKFYLDLPAKSVVVENIKRYNCGDLSMFFALIQEPIKETNTYRYNQILKSIARQTSLIRNK